MEANSVADIYLCVVVISKQKARLASASEHVHWRVFLMRCACNLPCPELEG